MTIENVLLVSAVLFAIGAYGVVSRSSLITVIMSLELMFNGVVIAEVALSRLTASPALPSGEHLKGEASRDDVAGTAFGL